MIQLQRYTGPWDDDDPDANFKREVAEYTRNDPLPMLEQFSENMGIPVGALVRYVLVRWTSEGSEALLQMGPRMVRRLNEVCGKAEDEGTDAARLAAYDQLRQMLAWVAIPLADDPAPPQSDQQDR